MNIVLFEKDRKQIILNSADYRFRHIKKVLKLEKGDSIKAGVINGKKGTAEIISISDREIVLETDFREDGCRPLPVYLLAGHPRPPAARRIIRDCTSFSVSGISFFTAVNSEKSYLQSSLWNKEEYQKALREGAEQGGHCFIPDLKVYRSLEEYFRQNDTDEYVKICFEREAGSKEAGKPAAGRTLLAIGPERGWVDSELELLKLKSFQFFSLGDTILRTETACAAAVSVINYINNFFRR